MTDHHQLSHFIWQIADLLRGPYRPPQYERVMLPLTVLRRFDCVLEDTKARVLAEHTKRAKNDEKEDKKVKGVALDAVLNRVAGQKFHNHSPLDFEKLRADPQNIAHHLTSYINGFSENVRLIFERFDFGMEIERMNEANILYLVVSKFCDVDLHPDAIDNIGMGLVFEELIRKFNELANETAGDHFTPREVIQLMIDILFTPDDAILTTPQRIFKLLDPACGTGGILSEGQKHLREMHAQAQLYVYGQDFNPRAYAIAASDLLLKTKAMNGSQAESVIKYGDTLTDDQFPDDQFDYLAANPPFGVDWKKQQKVVLNEHERLGLRGRFGAGLPRVNDGALLFLQHMVSKFIPYEEGSKKKTGSRLAVVFNGSPLFTGGAGSGESEIRKWIIERDWLEAIIALPEQMFYNTGIGTYIWIVTNRKEAHRQGKIQLIDGRDRWKPMRRSLGDKRRYLGEDDIAPIVREYGAFQDTATCKIFDNADFGYNRVQIDRPLRLLYTMDVERKARFLDAFPHLLDDVQAIDQQLGRTPREDWNDFGALMLELLKRRGSKKWTTQESREFRKVFTDAQVDPKIRPVVKDRRKAAPDLARVWGWFSSERGFVEAYEPNADLRDFENVDLTDVVERYVQDEVIRHVEDAWADKPSIRPAYEINFNRYFYTYTPPRPLAEIDAEIKQLEKEILRLLREVTE
ncbi:MAG TPA: class I SAM-dependent DNA methyltransferase [Aggregatilineales bacterium]|nr:class I SAM-dependent DNA methyltransferase [Aggregatilineales bacterium]